MPVASFSNPLLEFGDDDRDVYGSTVNSTSAVPFSIGQLRQEEPSKYFTPRVIATALLVVCAATLLLNFISGWYPWEYQIMADMVHLNLDDLGGAKIVICLWQIICLLSLLDALLNFKASSAAPLLVTSAVLSIFETIIMMMVVFLFFVGDFGVFRDGMVTLYRVMPFGSSSHPSDFQLCIHTFVLFSIILSMNLIMTRILEVYIKHVAAVKARSRDVVVFAL